MSTEERCRSTESLASRAIGLGVILVLIASLPLLLIAGILFVIWLGLFHLIIWVRYPVLVVFVYSESPKWKTHIESEILPAIPEGSPVLNWSKRHQWRSTSIAAHAFLLFGGSCAYCPMALVFERGRLVRKFKFFKPFQAAKHGDPRPLRELQEQFLQSIGGVL